MYDLTSSRLHPPPWPWLWLCKSVSSTGPLGLVSPASILVPELGRLRPGARGHLVQTQPLYTAGGHFLHLTVTQTTEIYKDSGARR